MVSNEEIVMRIQAGEDRQGNLGRLYENNRGLIAKIAARYLWAGELDDLTQEGFFGLVTAAERWTPEGGAVFSTYAAEWIRQAIQQYAENTAGVIRIPSKKARQIRQYIEFVRDYEAEHGRRPDEKNICAALEITPEHLSRLEMESATREACSLSAPAFGEDDGTTIGDTIPGQDTGADDVIRERYQTELGAFLWGLVDGLPGEQANVVRWRYRDGKTLAECDALLRAKRGKAVRVESEGLKALRRGKIGKQIQAFTGERLYSEGIRGAGLTSYRRTFTSATERAALLDMMRGELYECG